MPKRGSRPHDKEATHLEAPTIRHTDNSRRPPLIDPRVVAGKQVYVFESHNLALIPWAECRRTLGQKPRLFTLDFHTDTHQAFHARAAQKCAKFCPDPEDWQPIAQELVDAIQFEDPTSVAEAAVRLRYDEQIDAAIRANILDIAFVAAHNDDRHIESDQQRAADEERRTTPEFSPKVVDGRTVYERRVRETAPGPYTYSLPENGIVVLPRVSLPRGKLDPNGIQGEAYDRYYRDAAIEDDRLHPNIDLVNTFCKSVRVASLYEVPYILDFDLDYFNSRQSIEPSKPTVFYELIRRATITTVARESACVKDCRLEGEKVTSSSLEKALMEHIEVAAKPAPLGVDDSVQV